MRISCGIWPEPSIFGSEYFEAGEGGLLDGVGGEDGFGDLLEVIGFRAEGGGKFGKRGNEFFRRQRDADDAGGGREDFFRLAVKGFGGGFAGGARGVDAGLADRAVGVAGVDGDDAHFAAGGAEMFRIDEERCGVDAITGEGGGGGSRCVGDDQGEVSAAALLQSGLDGSKAKAAGNHKLRKVAHHLLAI